ncbi:MAG TPA: hypothetical protein ENI66_01150 [Candidatus Yonathbacteria bacterium]|nr:hypothetical protein [Candidatus Yonathbacteria bacterium]
MVAMTKKIEYELELLRSFAISIVGRDKEGSYKPTFVRRVLKTSMHTPTYNFTTPEKFLEDVKKYA